MALVPKNRREALVTLAGFAAAAFVPLANDLVLFESTIVLSSSMRPTILSNERIRLQRRLFRPLRRFVVVIDSREIGHAIVKRVVGLPGDCLRLVDGWRAELDGRELAYTVPADDPDARVEAGHHRVRVRRDPRWVFPTRHARERYCVPPGHHFVLGDNRLASDDSRSFGLVSDGELRGRMTLRGDSFDRRGRDGLGWDRVLTWVR